jgi:hypothetical protein
MQAAAVPEPIIGMMSTHPELLDHHVDCHTWMFFPPGLARFADWPDPAANRAPSPMLAQYDQDDQLFPMRGMDAAYRRIASHYQQVGHADAYLGQFYDGPTSLTPSCRLKLLPGCAPNSRTQILYRAFAMAEGRQRTYSRFLDLWPRFSIDVPGSACLSMEQSE